MPLPCALLFLLALAAPAPAATPGPTRLVIGLGGNATPRATASALSSAEPLLGAEAAPSTDDPASPFASDFSRVRILTLPVGAALDSALAAARRLPGVEWAEPEIFYECAAWGEPGRVPSAAPGPAPQGSAPPSPVSPRSTPRSAAPSPPGFHPNDPFYQDTRQWSLRNPGDGAYAGAPGADIGATRAWALSTGAMDLWLALADTGVDPGHPDLQTQIPGVGPRLARGLDATGTLGTWADSLGHGTVVAGVMAALTNNGALWDTLGMAGVCGGDGAGNPGCRVMPLRITPDHSRFASSVDIARALIYAARNHARVVNLSFASGASSVLVRQALLFAVSHGCLVVCAAGNRADSKPQYPACHAADGLCMAVGASDSFDQRAPWSSYGAWMDLLAPGTDIWSTAPTYPNAVGATFNGYLVWAGTSFAAPHATGAAGLLAARRPELLPDDLRELLRRSARDLGPPGPDSATGCGRLDAAAALESAGEGVGVWHDEVAPQSWRALDTGTLQVSEGGPGALADWVGFRDAERWELTARVAWPDSFAETPQAWVRAGGTFSVRGDYRLPYFSPWAEAVPDAGGLTLRGFVYRALDPGAGEAFAPLPPDQIRFAFTAIGRVRRAALAAASRVEGEPRAAPNPFRGALRVAGLHPGSVQAFDAAGRAVRRWRVEAGGTAIEWDGCDGEGRPVPAGLYLLRGEATAGRTLRVVRVR